MAETATSRSKLLGLGGRSLAVIAALALIVAAGDRANVRWDLSSDRRFTLSQKLVDLLRRQDEPIALVGIWNRDLVEAEPIAARLEEMAAENAKIAYRAIDPERDQPAKAEFEKRYQQRGTPGIYVGRGTRTFRIPLTYTTLRTLQREVGGALVALADPKPMTLDFWQGHGELRIGGGTENGSDAIRRELELAGFRCTDFESGKRQPSGGVLVIAGPIAASASNKFGATDLALLAEHLDNGGAVLLMADDRLPVDLAIWLYHRGIWMGPLKPIEKPEQLLAKEPEAGAPFVVASHQHYLSGANAQESHFVLQLTDKNLNPTHPTTQRIAGSGSRIVSPFTTPIDVPATDPDYAKVLVQAGMPELSATALMATVPSDAWMSERHDVSIPATLDEHPLPLAWAFQWQPKKESSRAGQGGRLVIWGSRQAASDGVITPGSFANGTLIADFCSWLSYRQPPEEIPPTDTASYHVLVERDTLFWFMAGLVALMPCCAIGAAILAWWERR